MESIDKNIEEVIKKILFRNQELESKVSALEAERAILEQKRATLEEEKAILEKENIILRNRLSGFECPKKDSHNSSIPPAAENLKEKAVRRTRSLRQPGGRPSGGQPGHKGATLTMRETPDMTQTHIPEYCPECGASLAGIDGEESETRQSIDIPLPVCPVVTNHVSISKTCPCGKCNRGTFPYHVKPGVSYGVNIHAVVAYLSTVQCIPFKRLSGTIKELYNLEISRGSISNILNRMRKQALPAYEAIRKYIEKSAVVGADETGEQLDGKLHWMWTFQNEVATYIFQHPSRGKAAIDSHFPNGLPGSIPVTDRHSSYFNMETAGHQVCLAHLLRNLIYLGELDKNQEWSVDLPELFRESIHLHKTVPLEQIDIGKIKGKFHILLEQDLGSPDKKFSDLQKGLRKHAGHIFRFLEHIGVPYDNNASERSIRPLKVKQKISGMFKSDDGADAFCTLHSIADTAKKNNQNPFMAFIAVAENILFTERG